MGISFFCAQSFRSLCRISWPPRQWFKLYFFLATFFSDVIDDSSLSMEFFQCLCTRKPWATKVSWKKSEKGCCTKSKFLYWSERRRWTWDAPKPSSIWLGIFGARIDQVTPLLRGSDCLPQRPLRFVRPCWVLLQFPQIKWDFDFCTCFKSSNSYILPFHLCNLDQSSFTCFTSKAGKSFKLFFRVFLLWLNLNCPIETSFRHLYFSLLIHAQSWHSIRHYQSVRSNHFLGV